MLKSYSKKIIQAFYFVFITIILLIAVLLIVSIFPIAGNYKFMMVMSGSMEPSIRTGAVVAVKPSPRYEIGDIVSFGAVGKNKIPTTHRVVEIKQEGNRRAYVTKGDANNAPDAKEISDKDIIGKVLFSVPYLGYAVAAAKQPIGFVLIIVIPAAIIIFEEMEKIWKELKRARAEKVKNKENNKSR